VTVKEWYSAGKTTTINNLGVFYRHSYLNSDSNSDNNPDQHSNPGNRETLVCIHGFPTSSWDFEPIWEQLGRRFNVIANDLIGLGRSEKPSQPITVGLQATIIETLLNTLGIKKAHIFAHDLGDTVAQELLARQAEGSSTIEWQSCVFLNGGLFPETHRPRLVQKLLASPLGPLLASLSSERTFHKTMTNLFSTENPPTKEFLTESWKLLIENNGRAMMPRLLRYMDERRVNRTRWVSPMENPIVPLRLINGIQDPISGLHAAERYRELVANADVVLLEQAGHYPHVENPEKVLSAFFEFHDALS